MSNNNNTISIRATSHINGNDGIYHFDDDTYDETIATYLAQCDPSDLAIADDHLSLFLSPPITNDNEGNANNPLQKSKVASFMPIIIWLANISCNFKSACKCCCNKKDAPAVLSTTSTTTNNNNIKGNTKNNEALNDKIISQEVTNSSSRKSGNMPYFPCIPREFTSKEHHRFDALQRSYHTALQQQQQQLLRFKTKMEEEERVSPSSTSTTTMMMYQLSPRLIIHDPRERSRMKDKLTVFLERRARDMEERLLRDLEQEEEEQKSTTRNAKKKEKMKKWKRTWSRLQMEKETKEKEKAVIEQNTAVRTKNEEKIKTNMQMTREKKNKQKTKKQQLTTAISKSSNDNEEKDKLLDNPPPSSSIVYAWCCDDCKSATFPTFDELTQHEAFCRQSMERNDKENYLEVEKEVEDEEESESDGEGEIIERILKNRSDRLPPLENRILISTSGIIIASSSSSSSMTSASSVSRGEESSRLDMDHPPIAEEEQSPGATIPMVASISENDRQGKVFDQQKENNYPRNKNLTRNSASPSCSTVDTTALLPFSVTAQDYLMTTVVIDYDNRVDDTALPEHCLDYSVNPEGPLGSSCDASEIMTGPAKEEDSSSLIHHSSVTYQNTILTAQNNFLTRQNQSLLSTNEELQCQLAAIKRQTVEAIQQIQLKAYIAETSLCATKDRATVVENLLVSIITDIAVDEVEEREVREAISTYSSMMISQKNHESATLPLSLQEKITASYPLRFVQSSKRLADSKDFGGWMFRNKTDDDVSSSHV